MRSALPRKRRKRRKHRQGWLKVLVRGTILATLLGSLYAFVRVSAAPKQGLPAAAPRTDWATQLPASIKSIDEALERLFLQLPPPELRPRGAGKVRWIQKHYDLPLPGPPSEGTVRAWFNTVEDAAAATGVKILEKETDSEVGVDALVGVDGLLTHTLSLHWPKHPFRVAIVLSGLGSDLRTAREATGLGLNFTFAIDAQAPFAAEIRDLAKLSAAELLLATSGRGEDEALPRSIASYSQVIQQGQQLMPEAFGIASMLTTSDFEPNGQQALLAVVRRLQLFALDTTGDLCPPEVETIGCIGRDIRIDAGATPETMRMALESIIPLAHTRKDVIVVGNAEPRLFEALRHILPQLRAAYVQIVPLSRIAADRQRLYHPSPFGLAAPMHKPV